MRIFVVDQNGNKSYLHSAAKTKNELLQEIGSATFVLNNQVFSISDVVAEADTSLLGVGTAIGGAVGLLSAAPLGIVIGGIIGGIIGKSAAETELAKVQRFNNGWES